MVEYTLQFSLRKDVLEVDTYSVVIFLLPLSQQNNMIKGAIYNES